MRLAPFRDNLAPRARGLSALALAVLATGCGGDGEAPGEAGLAYVGAAACASCHQAQTEAWTGSHHDLAMQPATPETVLGDFEGTTFTHRGVTTTFTREGDAFRVRTEGPDGALATFDVAYTFGVEPLQQYLIPFPDGRLQALSVAWDTRPEDAGGQRWFHLYPDEDIPPGDVLHWTGPSQTWNYMCAECHSTGLAKNYDLEADTYATAWEEVDVACEACHGPGSRHVDWAEAVADGGQGDPGAVAPGSSEAGAAPQGEAPGTARAGAGGRYGLTAELGDPAGGAWVMDTLTGIAARTAPPSGSRQIDTCGRCHSRRAPLHPEAAAGSPLLDTHLPQTLTEGLYHADGQIEDEVYVWGSFLQSAMYGAGVRCSDCHEPHGLELRAPGNAVCATCHLPSRFDTEAHHRHPTGSTGGQCVACHMPATTYMVVDPRRDHSLRVPRPDLAATLGTPDACTSCHEDREPAWAARAVAGWYPDGRHTEAHYGEALDAGRRGAPGSEERLVRLYLDPATPGIVRATALGALAAQPGSGYATVLQAALSDPDPLVRTTAVQSLDVVPVERRLPLAGALLNDTILAVRTQAARVLAPLHRESLPPGQVRILDRATAEMVDALAATLDHPSAHLSLARLHADLGDADRAEQDLETALRIGDWYVPAWVNLADLYRAQGREADAEALLERGLERFPEQATLHHAIGLLYARTDRPDASLAALAEAARLAPEDPRNPYAYALALNGQGRGDEAIRVLDDALEDAPNDPRLLHALATFHRDAGRTSEALTYARRLGDIRPGDPGVQALIDQLVAAAGTGP